MRTGALIDQITFEYSDGSRRDYGDSGGGKFRAPLDILSQHNGYLVMVTQVEPDEGQTRYLGARWDFLVFDFNEHQIEEARAKAKQWGVEEFVVKKSSRFITGHTSEKKESHQGQNRKGKKTQLLKEPSSKALKNPALLKRNSLVEKYGSMDKFYDVAEIACRVAKTGSIYLSAEGIIMPCCWTAGRMYKWWHKDPKVEQIWSHIDEVGGKQMLDAKNGLDKVFNTGIFDSIEQSWNIDGCSNGKLKVCSMKCGKEFDPFAEQFN